MIIKDVMTKNPVCVTTDTTITEAKDIMDKNGFSKLPVLDKSKRLVGIITKKGIAKASPSGATTLDKYEIQSLLAKVTCGEVMAKHILTVTENEVVEEAARLMIEKDIGCIPVVNDDCVVGIITDSDLFALFTNMFGASYHGVRVNFVLPDEPGQLAAAMAKMGESGANIVSVITRESGKTGCRRVTIKATGIEDSKMKSILESVNAEIIDLRVV